MLNRRYMLVLVLVHVLVLCALGMYRVTTARADDLPAVDGLVTELTVGAFELHGDDGGGDITVRGAKVAVAVGHSIGPRAVMGARLGLFRPVDQGGPTLYALYLDGFGTVRLPHGFSATGELTAARLHLGHRADSTGLGVGGRIGYELAAGGRVATGLHVGARWLHTIEDEGSTEAGDTISFEIGGGVTWY